MSGIIGHVTYAVLGVKAAEHRQLPVAPVIRRHWATYLAGSYLGCDIQTMPEAVCVDTGQEIGYGTVEVTVSPFTGGAVRPFLFRFEGQEYTPRQIHSQFYGRSHLTFGYRGADVELTLPWDHLCDYTAAVVEDAVTLFGPAERPLAYVLGWMTHLIGDGLIKSIAPGLTLHLLDGKYTAKNRPIQDLVSFHEIGRKELGLDWPAMLADLSETPVEAVQLHCMRIGTPRGRLAARFAEGWLPEKEPLLHAVLAENRRYLQKYYKHLLTQMELQRTEGGLQCNEELQKTAGGLDYAQMVEAARAADFRYALWQIAEAVADLFARVVPLVPSLYETMGNGQQPTWAELTDRWKPSAK